jgi:hypothetical protein
MPNSKKKKQRTFFISNKFYEGMFTKCCTCYHQLSCILDNFIEHFVFETIANLKVEFAVRSEATTQRGICFYFPSKLIIRSSPKISSFSNVVK